MTPAARRVGVIDYGLANIRSVVNALSCFDVDVAVAETGAALAGVGRTISIYYGATFGGLTLGSWLWGAIAQSHGLPTAMAASGGALLLVAAAGLVFPLRESTPTE